ncbi:MAG: serine/threonine protein kinase [Myxococcales bacterium]|nr:serine/threonine protein kinase [Myxococcales bacterium]
MASGSASGSPPAWRPGTRVGRFVVLEELGGGGMGLVLAAYDRLLDRRVAIKVLQPAISAGDSAVDARQRLVNEAQLVAKLNHPNIITVYEAGVSGDEVYLAMEFVEGPTLGEWLKTPRRTAEILGVFAAAGRALHAAHVAGIVHRDFKPENVIVATDTRGVRVIDFGIAAACQPVVTNMPAPRSPSSDDAAASDAGGLVGAGTPAYMAPEQHTDAQVDATADQFAYGVALYEALHGLRPFRRTERRAITAALDRGLPTGDRALSRPQRQAVARMIALEPADRFPTMALAVRALERGRRGWRWPVALAAGLAAGVLGGQALARSRHAGPPDCARVATDRATLAWSPAHAAQVATQFAATRRPQAAGAAHVASAGLDDYHRRWVNLATDACTANRAPTPPPADLTLRRAACLDGRLDALRTLGALLAGAPRGELVDNVEAMLDGLPTLADCSDAASLSSSPIPPAATRVAIAALAQRVDAARNLVEAGLYDEADAALTALGPEVDAAAWSPLRIEQLIARGTLAKRRMEPDGGLLVEAAEAATALNLQRTAARAWNLALEHAGETLAPTDLLAAIARATAAATSDPVAQAAVEVAQGRAANALARAGAAPPLCRAALARLDAANAPPGLERAARMCVAQGLFLEQKFEEARPMLEQIVAEVTAQYGPQAPQLIQAYDALAISAAQLGDRPAGLRLAERALAIAEAIYGPDHLAAVDPLAKIAQLTDDRERAMATSRRALTLADAPTAGRRGHLAASQIYLKLAMREYGRGMAMDRPALRDHLDRAITAARAADDSPRSWPLAAALLDYGQYEVAWDLDAGIAKLAQAQSIMELRGDPNAWMPHASQLIALVDADRLDQVLPELIAFLDPAPAGLPPVTRAWLELTVARGLVAHRRPGATTWADRALATAVAAGPDGAGMRAEIEAWRASHPDR